MQAAAARLDPIATEALAILEKKLMEDVSRDAAEVRNERTSERINEILLEEGVAVVRDRLDD